MKFAAISAALALLTLTNAMPATPTTALQAGKKDKSDCEKEFKKDLKKLKPEVSAYCSSFIATTTTIVVPTTITEAVTAFTTIFLTETTTTTTTGPAPTVTKTVYSDCGIVGFDSGAVPAYFFDGSGALGTFEACKARCQQDAGKCLSFAFGSGQCLLYAANVASTAVQVAGSPYTFNAVNCPAPAAAPAPSAVAKREARPPKPLDEYQPAERSAFCSCVIAVAPTSTVIASTTSTVATTATIAITVVTAAIETTTVVPGPVTVTVTTTA